MLGKHKIVVDTTVLANGDSLAAYLTSAAGTLLTHTTNGSKQALDVYDANIYAEDAAHSSGDLGGLILGVRRDADTSPVSADGDYQTLLFDANGKLKVTADLDVDFDFVYAEDSAANSGDLLSAVALVRQDTLAASTSADGDYGHFKSNNLGELYVFDTTTHATLASLLTELQSLTHAEDAAHVSGDLGVMSLAVRNDTPGSLAGANGDYAPLQVDSSGNLRVVGTLTFLGQYLEDATHSSGDTGLQFLAVRKDAQGSNVSADGDYASLLAWSEGSLKVVDIRNGGVLQQQIAVAATATPLPTAALANRKTLTVQNVGSSSFWIGSNTVTASGATTGIEIPKGGFVEFNLGPAVTLYGITASGTVNANILEAA